MKKKCIISLVFSLLCTLGIAQNRSAVLGRAEIPLNLNNYSTFTISTWVKPGNNSSLSAVYTNDNGGYDIALHVYNGQWVIFHNRWINTGVNYSINKWYHTATVFSPTATKFYINGQLVYTGNGSISRAGDALLGFGYNYSNYPRHEFYGEIDELRIWNYERSQQEIDGDRLLQLSGSESGLLAYYSFNSDNFNDESGNGNNGINTAGLSYSSFTIPTPTPDTTSTPVDSCITSLNFDGVNDYVQLANPLTIGNSSSTVELRVKVPLAGNGGLSPTERVGNILGNYNSSRNANWEIHNDGQLRIWWKNGQIDRYGSVDLRDGLWHHVAFVRNKTDNTFKAYVDGVLDISVNTAGTDLVFTTAHRIGGDRRSSAGGPSFHGEMTELRVWNVAKSQTELLMLASGSLIGNEVNLVNYYPFNEGSGNALTDLTGSNNGTLTNMDVNNDWSLAFCDTIQVPVDTTCNYTLDFDGVNDYVQLANPLTIGNGSSTVELRVKVPLAGNGGLSPTERVGNILGNYNSSPNANWEIHNDGQLRIWWKNGQIDRYGSVDLRDGLWHHVAFVRNKTDNTFKAYVDGVTDISVNTAGTDLAFTTAHRIGGDRRSTAGGPSFHGEMDEFRIWNVAKTASELQALSTVSLAGTESGLLHYYNFNNGEGASLTDLAGTNNGVLTNMTPSADWKLLDGTAACTASSRKKSTSIISDLEDEKEFGFAIYPNPTSGIFTLDVGKLRGEAVISLMDFTGKLISKNTYLDFQHVQFNIEQPSGIYLLRVELEGQLYTKKIIKE